jgi:hypothetical protein
MRAPATLPLVWPEVQPRRMTGAVELALAEAGGGGTRPERVTAVLSAIFETIGDGPATPGRVALLSTGTRAWLLAQAAAARGAGSWYQANCTACGTPFDFPLALSDLPRGPAGSGFPVAHVATSRGVRAFEVPNGAHEAALARGGDRRRLVALLALEPDEDWDDADLDAIEAGIDAVAPDIGEEVACTCPACGAATLARIDLLPAISAGIETILAEVHLLARAYGWREPAILALPGARRRAYARMIRGDRR